MKMKKRYKINKLAKIGDECVYPSCGIKFVKKYYQQAFCQTKKGTICKDKYWNTIIPEKRNNTTRISPASAKRMEKNKKSYDPEDSFHPQDPSALGQWED